MPLSEMQVTRHLSLAGREVRIEERVDNLGAWDRPIAWTQHVTLGPPFLQRGKTRFELTATRSRTFEGEFGNLFASGVDFDWPSAPLKAGGTYDLRTYSEREVSAGYTAHLMDPSRADAGWTATDGEVTFGYRWKREDFPWCGIWEENCFRQSPPWSKKTITRGMEFGVSPVPCTRREMIERGPLFGVPGYRWLPARGTLSASYVAFFR
jgi:hypothetical protein